MSELKPCPFCGGEAYPPADENRPVRRCYVLHEKGCFFKPLHGGLLPTFIEDEIDVWNSRFERECRFSVASYDDDERGIWESECGGRFEFACATPIENWEFCPKCGGKVVE